VIKSGKLRCMGHVSSLGEKVMHITFWLKSIRFRYNLGDIVIDRKIILK